MNDQRVKEVAHGHEDNRQMKFLGFDELRALALEIQSRAAAESAERQERQSYSRFVNELRRENVRHETEMAVK